MTTIDIHKLCVDLVSLPRKLNQDGNISFHSLLKKSGYFEMHDQITIDAIREVLVEHPGSVNNWIQFSEDQRCDHAWFFRKSGTDYEVGFFSSEADKVPVTKYSDPLEACATFIKHKIESVRLND